MSILEHVGPIEWINRLLCGMYIGNPPNHGLELTGLISALFDCITRYGVAWPATAVSRIRPAAQP